MQGRGGKVRGDEGKKEVIMARTWSSVVGGSNAGFKKLVGLLLFLKRAMGRWDMLKDT